MPDQLVCFQCKSNVRHVLTNEVLWFYTVNTGYTIVILTISHINTHNNDNAFLKTGTGKNNIHVHSSTGLVLKGLVKANKINKQTKQERTFTGSKRAIKTILRKKGEEWNKDEKRGQVFRKIYLHYK